MRLLASAILGMILASSQSAAQSDRTCIGYLEADAVYQDTIRHLDAEEARLSPVVRDILGKHSPARLEAARTRLQAYMAAYNGPTSKVEGAMVRLLEADRWRCCKQFEPDRMRYRFGCQVRLRPTR